MPHRLQPNSTNGVHQASLSLECSPCPGPSCLDSSSPTGLFSRRLPLHDEKKKRGEPDWQCQLARELHGATQERAGCSHTRVFCMQNACMQPLGRTSTANSQRARGCEWVLWVPRPNNISSRGHTALIRAVLGGVCWSCHCPLPVKRRPSAILAFGFLPLLWGGVRQKRRDRLVTSWALRSPLSVYLHLHIRLTCRMRVPSCRRACV